MKQRVFEVLGSKKVSRVEIRSVEESAGSSVARQDIAAAE